MAHGSRLTAHGSRPELYIIAPAYNESQNILQFIEDWYPVIERHNANNLSRLVIIDDGSKDNTYKILQDSAREKNLLLPLTKQNGGHGAALLYGYKYAIDNGAKFIFQTDSDGQTLASEFESFWEQRNNYDAILGKRPDRKDGASRKFVENTLRMILRVIFGVRVPDANCPFRLMRSELVAKYIDRMPKDFNLPNVMLTTYFAYYNEKINFCDVTFRPRQGGVNSINIRKIIKIGMKAVKDFYILKNGLK